MEELVAELRKVIPCTCDNAYKNRNLSAPDCPYCNYVDDLAAWVKAREIRAMISVYLEEGYSEDSVQVKEWKRELEVLG